MHEEDTTTLVGIIPLCPGCDVDVVAVGPLIEVRVDTDWMPGGVFLLLLQPEHAAELAGYLSRAAAIARRSR